MSWRRLKPEQKGKNYSDAVEAIWGDRLRYALEFLGVALMVILFEQLRRSSVTREFAGFE